MPAENFLPQKEKMRTSKKQKIELYIEFYILK